MQVGGVEQEERGITEKCSNNYCLNNFLFIFGVLACRFGFSGEKYMGICCVYPLTVITQPHKKKKKKKNAPTPPNRLMFPGSLNPNPWSELAHQITIFF